MMREPGRTAVIICDVWDTHHCVMAARRVGEMAPGMNATVAALRSRGALVIHAPHDCMDFYRDTTARRRAIDAPRVEAPVPFDWHGWHTDPHAEELPATLTDPGPCSCDAAEPCGDGQPPYPWTRQIAAIEIDARDAVSDDGHEIFNLLRQYEIEDVVVMGVHTNICVLARPYGIRQLVALGKRPVLCRDLTDAFHRDPHGHDWGTQEVVGFIERHWCPTITSGELVARAYLRGVLP